MWLPKGFIGYRKFWQAFFEFFLTILARNLTNISEARIQAGWNVATRYRCAPKVTIVLLIHVSQDGVEIRSRARLRAGASRLKFGWLALFFFANSFERPVLRRSVSDEWRETRFAGDQIRSVKFSFERQGSRVTPHIAD